MYSKDCVLGTTWGAYALIGGWIGWAFLWNEAGKYTTISYACHNVTLGTTTGSCGSGGCNYQTPYALDCTGPQKIHLQPSGTYDADFDTTRKYFNESFLGKSQTGLLYNGNLVSENGITPWQYLMLGALLIVTITIPACMFDRIQSLRKQEAILMPAIRNENAAPEAVEVLAG